MSDAIVMMFNWLITNSGVRLTARCSSSSENERGDALLPPLITDYMPKQISNRELLPVSCELMSSPSACRRTIGTGRGRDEKTGAVTASVSSNPNKKVREEGIVTERTQWCRARPTCCSADFSLTWFLQLIPQSRDDFDAVLFQFFLYRRIRHRIDIGIFIPHSQTGDISTSSSLNKTESTVHFALITAGIIIKTCITEIPLLPIVLEAI